MAISRTCQPSRILSLFDQMGIRFESHGKGEKRSKIHPLGDRFNQSDPAVPSEGNLDPYDGYITYRLVDELTDERQLASELAEMKSMVDLKYARYRSWDPLDLGEALWITHWYPDEPWSQVITRKSLQALEELWQRGEFRDSLNQRLAFREFGTTIGVQVNDTTSVLWKDRVDEIHRLWLPHLYKRDQDISPVMFCTSLRPGVIRRSYL